MQEFKKLIAEYEAKYPEEMEQAGKWVEENYAAITANMAVQELNLEDLFKEQLEVTEPKNVQLGILNTCREIADVLIQKRVRLLTHIRNRFEKWASSRNLYNLERSDEYPYYYKDHKTEEAFHNQCKTASSVNPAQDVFGRWETIDCVPCPVDLCGLPKQMGCLQIIKDARTGNMKATLSTDAISKDVEILWALKFIEEYRNEIK